MSNWRDAILDHFVPNVSRLTLVADPDSLMTEEKLTIELRQRGFDLIEFNDPVEFRYAYESKYRSTWDHGEQTDLVVILRLRDAEIDALPYDLLQAGRKLSFNLGQLFPNLSYPVIESLDRSLLDAIFEAQKQFCPERMGDNATMDFILRHVFAVDPVLIKNEVDLLRTLLRIHYNKWRIPGILNNRLVQLLQEQGNFRNWPLNEIITDEEAFFEFIQERWPAFLESRHKASADKDSAREDVFGYPINNQALKYCGPEVLPFDHHDIRVYIDNLFIEGRLTPVKAGGIRISAESWVQSGISEEADNDDERIGRLFEIVENELPDQEARHSDWTAFAMKWAELSALVISGNKDEYRQMLKQTGDKINMAFAQWLSANYAGMINLPPANPAMLHHVPRRLGRDMERSKGKRVALLVVDGLSLDQWITVRQSLQQQGTDLLMRESAVFAWVPTLTSVSRQAVFSGKLPLYFPASIYSTNKEGHLWRQFWESSGLSRMDIIYQRGLGDGDAQKELESVINPETTRAAGLVVDKIDRIMHGMQLGAAGMHGQIKQWCETGFLRSMIEYLVHCGFDVWMTSDHGNIECYGKGRPSEGVIAETSGERSRIYSTSEFRSQVAAEFDFAYEWTQAGLPSDYFPLVAGGRNAFVRSGDCIVGHGGIAIEEVIVPLVKFERKGR
ncbi:MAG: BREX-3 system phosphatase PglZ [Desulfosudaceae bacterium]